MAEYRKRKELIILDMKMKLNSVGISEVFNICGRRALAAIEPCIFLTIRPEGGPPTIFDKRLTDFLCVIRSWVNYNLFVGQQCYKT